MNPTTITIDDRTHLHKRDRYTPYILPYAIIVDSGDSISNLTTPFDPTYLITSDDPNTIHVMSKGVPLQGRVHSGYCCRKHGQKICYKRQGSIAPHALIRKRGFIIIIFPGLF